MSGVDELLDARSLRHFADQPSLRSVVDRQILLHLLEHLAGDDADSWRRRLEAAPTGEPEHLVVEPIAGADRYLCELA